MWLIARFRSVWERGARTPELPEDVEAALARPLFTRVYPLLQAHVTGICVCAVVFARIAQLWPAAFLAALVGLLALRGWLLVQARRASAFSPLALLRWRKPYQAVGIAWVVVSSLFCVFCVVASGDEITRILALALAFGSASGTATRNAGTPRFAVVQLCIWLMPLMALAPLLGPWYPALSVGLALYLAALCSIVRQHHRDMLSLVTAERHEAALAFRLDAALNNMTQGLVMFDAAGALQVVNRRFHELFAAPPNALPSGLTEAEFEAACAAPQATGDLLAQPSAGSREGASAVLDFPDGRAFAGRTWPCRTAGGS